MSAGPPSLWGLWGRRLPASSSFWGLQRLSDCGRIPPASALPSVCAYLHVSVSEAPSLLLERRQPVDLGPILIQYDLILTELIKCAKTLLPNKVTFGGSGWM